MLNIFNSLKKQPGFIMLVNMFTLMVVYMLTRWFFYWMNVSEFQDVTMSDMLTMSLGGLRFDLSALCYLNIICVILQFLPIKGRDTVNYQKVVKVIFLVINSVGIFANVADVVYFSFGGRRTTSTFFSEFGNEDNIGAILAQSLNTYWPAWVFGIAAILAIIFLYYNPIKQDKDKDDYPDNKPYYIISSVIFVLAVYLTVGGLRGGFGLKMHPMRQDSADIYCKKPVQAAIVLNTPFTLITTIHKHGYMDPDFFEPEDLDTIFNPIHNLSPDGGEMKKLNVVVILMEGFSMEFTGYFNHDKDNGTYQGYTPFLDSLLSQSYCFKWSFANGIRSVDCMPSSFAGVPRYIEPYCYYFYSNNTLQGLPEMLKDEGYNTAFFHGAPNTTLGFLGFTNSIGFQQYYGMTEYNNDADFDGTWAIWDEPFFQYFAEGTDRIASDGKPFFVTIFSASSHDPFKVPAQYEGKFPEGTIPDHKAVGYSDYSLRKYFETVSKMSWFKNTVFVFTADHCGPAAREDYNNEMGRFLIPIFFYTPGGQLPAKCDSSRLMEQTDITPTILGLLNYQKPYFSFGKDVFEKDSTKFVNYVFNDRNGNSMYYLDTLMIEYRNNQLYGIFDYTHDFQLQNNLLEQRDKYPQVPFMERQIKAIIQQYIERMKKNTLSYK